MDDQNDEEAYKEFILTRVDEVYLKALYQPRIRYNGVTLQQFMDVLINDFQATPEEREEVRKLIDAPWDPNQHIITLFADIKKHLTTLAEIKNAIPYPAEDFNEAVYMVVSGTKKFIKSCEKWKRKPVGDRSTEAQVRTFFKDVYEIFDANRNSFHEIGVAYNAVMQGKLNKISAENTQMKQQLAENQAVA